MNNIKIGIIGLGYVGLPLARLFATKYPVVGFDINKQRVDQLNKGFDKTLEIDENTLKSVLVTKNPTNVKFLNDETSAPSFSEQLRKNGLFCTSNLSEIKSCNFYIITVPTPVDRNNRPDLTPLKKASEIIGMSICTNDIVVYESTVYPGATEEDCIPVIEKISGFKNIF